MANRYNFIQIEHKFYQYLSDQSGSTAIEYGIFAAGIGCVVLGLAGVIGHEINSTFAHDLLPAFGLTLAGSELETLP